MKNRFDAYIAKKPLDIPPQALHTIKVTDTYFAGERYKEPVKGAVPLIAKALFSFGK